MIKKVLFLIGVLIFVDIAVFAWINHGGAFVFHYEPFLAQTQWDMGLATIGLALYTVIGVFLLFFPYISGLKAQLKKQSRSNEKAAIVSEESSDKVMLLQAKIDTLEKALSDALKSKD